MIDWINEWIVVVNLVLSRWSKFEMKFYESISNQTSSAYVYFKKKLIFSTKNESEAFGDKFAAFAGEEWRVGWEFGAGQQLATC